MKVLDTAFYVEGGSSSVLAWQARVVENAENAAFEMELTIVSFRVMLPVSGMGHLLPQLFEKDDRATIHPDGSATWLMAVTRLKPKMRVAVLS